VGGGRHATDDNGNININNNPLYAEYIIVLPMLMSSWNSLIFLRKRKIINTLHTIRLHINLDENCALYKRKTFSLINFIFIFCTYIAASPGRLDAPASASGSHLVNAVFEITLLTAQTMLNSVDIYRVFCDLPSFRRVKRFVF
jgi:hypothetical protein